MARIAAVSTALPPYVYPQAAITAEISDLITHDPRKRLLVDRLHRSSRVETRHLAMPLERYREAHGFTWTNELFVRTATELAERTVRDALDSAGLDPADVDFVMFTSVTGVSAPSVDGLLVARLGLRSDVKRVPMYGLGCVAGAAGIARVQDYLAGHPDDVAVLVSVELCSLTLQHGDDSMGNIVASGLFGDGAAAVVMLGDRRAEASGVAGLDVIDTRSRIYPDTEDVIGFDAGETGFRIVLTARVAEVVRDNFGADAAAFLSDNGCRVGDIAHFVAHPGGPRVLETFAETLSLDDDELRLSWESLSRVGNLSSASVLHILADTLASSEQTAGDDTLLFALGPGVSAELVLLRWAA